MARAQRRFGCLGWLRPAAIPILREEGQELVPRLVHLQCHADGVRRALHRDLPRVPDALNLQPPAPRQHVLNSFNLTLGQFSLILLRPRRLLHRPLPQRVHLGLLHPLDRNARVQHVLQHPHLPLRVPELPEDVYCAPRVLHAPHAVIVLFVHDPQIAVRPSQKKHLRRRARRVLARLCLGDPVPRDPDAPLERALRLGQLLLLLPPAASGASEERRGEEAAGLGEGAERASERECANANVRTRMSERE